jgi:hypothetical protein
MNIAFLNLPELLIFIDWEALTSSRARSAAPELTAGGETLRTS